MPAFIPISTASIPIETFLLGALSVFFAYLATQGLKAASKRLSNTQLGLIGVLCAIGFLINIGLIVSTEPPSSTKLTPFAVPLLAWVSLGNECFKRATEEEA